MKVERVVLDPGDELPCKRRHILDTEIRLPEVTGREMLVVWYAKPDR